MNDDRLDEAITLARRGHYEDARRLFVQVLESQPNSEFAWLWLGRILPTVEQRRYCLERVLKINPTNNQARNALDVLGFLEALQPVSSNEVGQTQQASTATEVRRIGDYLVELGYVRREDVEGVATRQAALRAQGKEFTIGNLLLDYRYVTHEQLYAAVREQERAYQACFGA